MESANPQIQLSGTQVLIPQEARDAYRVLSGSVLVFIVPWQNDAPGRRLLLCEVPQGKFIPSFVYRDRNFESWRFLLLARDTAVLERRENGATSILLRNFARFANLEAFEQEGFHQSLVEFYHREKLKDNIYIDRGKKRAPDVNIASYGVIRKAFSQREDYGGGDDPTFKSVVFACRRMGIPVVSYERLVNTGIQEVTVPEIARASRIACRRVVLEPNWYRSDCGILFSTVEGKSVSCVPRRTGGYDIYYGETDTCVPLTPEIAGTVDPKAYTVCRTLPGRKLDIWDLVRFVSKSIPSGDLISVVVLTLISTLIGVLLPTLNQKIYDEYIPLGNVNQMVQLCLVIATFMIGNLLFGIVKNLSENRLTSRAAYDLQNAIYYRVFHLPENFFRKFDSADLAERLNCGSLLASTLVNTVVLSGISAVMSLIYLVRMFQYSSRLAWWAVLMILAYGLIVYVLNVVTRKYDRKIAENSGKASAKLYQFLNGIEKIRTAGVEDQAAYEYLLPFSRIQTDMIRKNRIASFGGVLEGVISTVFSMVLYYVLIKSKSGVTMGAFLAFNTAFGAFSGCVMAWLQELTALLQLRPSYRRFKPIIQTPQEDEENSEIVGELSGAVSLEHVSFSYADKGPLVLDDISLNIRPGEYVGIVGPSGCGKSTLLKLLLGFETPGSGQICYDGHDLRSLDKRELRKHLGVVLQNGKLIAGSIFENITITAPRATLKDVQQVVEAVGLKEDIAQMPMGLHTVLSENAGTISGGQQQRILIARAIISRPSILIFDEATSALDNLTQEAVCDSLAKMNVTRIVVAHRLSTIKGCDRILVLKGGKIAEEGNYQQLMERRGIFYQLANRQIVD